MNILNKHAPVKEKVIKRNNAPFMNKILTKAKSNNKYNKNYTGENFLQYKKERKYCVYLLKRANRNIKTFMNICKDTKIFWKNIRTLFSRKLNGYQKEMTLMQ